MGRPRHFDHLRSRFRRSSSQPPVASLVRSDWKPTSSRSSSGSKFCAYQPQNDTAQTAIGKYFDDAGDTAAAVPYYREAARLKPDSGQNHYSYGIVLFKTNNFKEAAAEFAEGARLLPDDERVVNLAMALSLIGETKALVAIRAALRSAPNEWTFYNNQGEILANLGRHQEAIESYQRAHPDQPRRSRLLRCYRG